MNSRGKYYLCNDYRPSDDGAYGYWNRLYGSVFRKLRYSGCCAASYSRRKSGKKNIEYDTKLSIVSMADLEKHVQMRVHMIVYLILDLKRVF